jgi:hypothetical protein
VTRRNWRGADAKDLGEFLAGLVFRDEFHHPALGWRERSNRGLATVPALLPATGVPQGEKKCQGSSTAGTVSPAGNVHSFNPDSSKTGDARFDTIKGMKQPTQMRYVEDFLHHTLHSAQDYDSVRSMGGLGQLHKRPQAQAADIHQFADIHHQLFVPSFKALLANLLELKNEVWIHQARDLDNPGTSFSCGFEGHWQT